MLLKDVFFILAVLSYAGAESSKCSKSFTLTQEKLKEGNYSEIEDFIHEHVKAGNEVEILTEIEPIPHPQLFTTTTTTGPIKTTKTTAKSTAKETTTKAATRISTVTTTKTTERTPTSTTTATKTTTKKTTTQPRASTTAVKATTGAKPTSTATTAKKTKKETTTYSKGSTTEMKSIIGTSTTTKKPNKMPRKCDFWILGGCIWIYYKPGDTLPIGEARRQCVSNNATLFRVDDREMYNVTAKLLRRSMRNYMNTNYTYTWIDLTIDPQTVDGNDSDHPFLHWYKGEHNPQPNRNNTNKTQVTLYIRKDGAGDGGKYEGMVNVNPHGEVDNENSVQSAVCFRAADYPAGQAAVTAPQKCDFSILRGCIRIYYDPDNTLSIREARRQCGLRNSTLLHLKSEAMYNITANLLRQSMLKYTNMTYSYTWINLTINPQETYGDDSDHPFVQWYKDLTNRILDRNNLNKTQVTIYVRKDGTGQDGKYDRIVNVNPNGKVDNETNVQTAVCFRSNDYLPAPNEGCKNLTQNGWQWVEVDNALDFEKYLLECGKSNAGVRSMTGQEAYCMFMESTAMDYACTKLLEGQVEMEQSWLNITDKRCDKVAAALRSNEHSWISDLAYVQNGNRYSWYLSNKDCSYNVTCEKGRLKLNVTAHLQSEKKEIVCWKFSTSNESEN